MDAKRLPNLRLLPGRFMVIEQAMGLPKPNHAEAHIFLPRFVAEMKSSDFIANALKKTSDRRGRFYAAGACDARQALIFQPKPAQTEHL